MFSHTYFAKSTEQLSNEELAYRNYVKGNARPLLKKEETNHHFSKTDQKFIDACSKAGVEPTSRQASKWKRKMGKAYNEGR